MNRILSVLIGLCAAALLFILAGFFRSAMVVVFFACLVVGLIAVVVLDRSEIGTSKRIVALILYAVTYIIASVVILAMFIGPGGVR